MKNAIASGEYAPTAALEQLLGMVSQALTGRIDALASTLHEACPDLPDAAHDTVVQVIASARAEWIRSTATLAADTQPELQDEN